MMNVAHDIVPMRSQIPSPYLLLSGVSSFFLAIIAASGCGLQEAHFQQAWRSRLAPTRLAVLAFYQTHGRLPISLAEVQDEQPVQIDYVRSVYYEKRNDNTFMLCFRRSDIESGIASARIDPGATVPAEGDVFGEFDTTGKELRSSWAGGT